MLPMGAAPWGTWHLQTVRGTSVSQPCEWSLLYWGEKDVTEAASGSSVRGGAVAGTLPRLGSHHHRSGLCLFSSRSALPHLPPGTSPQEAEGQEGQSVSLPQGPRETEMSTTLPNSPGWVKAAGPRGINRGVCRAGAHVPRLGPGCPPAGWRAGHTVLPAKGVSPCSLWLSLAAPGQGVGPAASEYPGSQGATWTSLLRWSGLRVGRGTASPAHTPASPHCAALSRSKTEPGPSQIPRRVLCERPRPAGDRPAWAGGVCWGAVSADPGPSLGVPLAALPHLQGTCSI